jgi:hypothetical protein
MKRQTMSTIYVPTESATDWKKLLADPEKHWKKGYSARTLANCWESADGFPKEISALLSTSPLDPLQSAQLVMAFPEHKVFLPPVGGHPSQNDLFVLGKASDGDLISITVEGKVSESFDKTLGEWSKRPSAGKTLRLQFLQGTLGLTSPVPASIRYQLLHRLASAIIEATRFNAKYAILVVHSFSKKDLWFGDYSDFLDLFSVKATIGQLIQLPDMQGIHVLSGWARGDKRFLIA